MPLQLSEKCLFDAFGSRNYGKNSFQYANKDMYPSIMRYMYLCKNALDMNLKN